MMNSLYGGFMLQKEIDKPYISAPLQEFNRIYKKSNEINLSQYCSSAWFIQQCV